MKSYNVKEIITDVRVVLDLNEEDTSLASINNDLTLSIDEIISSKIPDGIRIIHNSAPYSLLDGMNYKNNIFWGDLNSGYILLSDDFMRLVIFKMSDWERPVYNTITPDSVEYRKQSSKFKGCRGTTQKPVAAITARPSGKALEFYSCKDTGATIDTMVYIPYPAIDSCDCYKISEKCYSAVIYSTASIVASTLGDNNKSTILDGLSKTLLR